MRQQHWSQRRYIRTSKMFHKYRMSVNYFLRLSTSFTLLPFNYTYCNFTSIDELPFFIHSLFFLSSLLQFWYHLLVEFDFKGAGHSNSNKLACEGESKEDVHQNVAKERERGRGRELEDSPRLSEKLQKVNALISCRLCGNISLCKVML